MQHRTTFWILLSLAFLLTLWAAPASAGLDTWYFGGSFNVGGVFFRVGYAEAGPFGSSFYFEAAQPFRYRGYACSSYCYRQGPRYYHHPSCSAVHHHFGHHGYAPGYFLERYGPPLRYPPPVHYYAPPRWNVHYHGSYGRYDRHHRYDRDRFHRNKKGRWKHDRGRNDRYWNDRYRYDRRQGKRKHDDRDRRHGGRFDHD